jgi:hypothetical protein
MQYLTPDDGQKTCPKLVEFHSKNKFEKLVHFFGFIIRKITRNSFIKAVSWNLDGRILDEGRVTHYRKPKLCHAEVMFSTLLHILRYFIKLRVYLEISN